MTPQPIMERDEAAFIGRYGALFEHSPWVVERAAARQPPCQLGDVQILAGVETDLAHRKHPRARIGSSE